MSDAKGNVIRLYDVRPEMALEHLQRSSGVTTALPRSSVAVEATPIKSAVDDLDEFPILTDIVDLAAIGKA